MARYSDNSHGALASSALKKTTKARCISSKDREEKQWVNHVDPVTGHWAPSEGRITARSGALTLYSTPEFSELLATG
jgi:hypothetical protein